MEQFDCTPGFLELISCPAFFVKNGLVTCANSDAQNLLITPGTSVDTLIETGKNDYNCMRQESCLSLSIQTEGRRFCAFVNRKEDTDLFLLDQEENDPTQLALSLASCSFRGPLNRVMSGADCIRRLPGELDPKVSKYLNEISKGAYQILRLVTNMSDLIPYSQERFFCQLLDIPKELEEIVQKAAILLEQNNVCLRFSTSVKNLIMPANKEKLERAVHNLILNAATYPSGKEPLKIEVALKQVDSQVHITVSDNGRGISDEIFSSLFYRYRRTPSVENCRYGIGLGLPLVRAVAIAHGGTVLIERMNPNGTRVTLTMEIRECNESMLRAPRLYFDYAGEFDHTLVELSDIISSDCYEKM